MIYTYVDTMQQGVVTRPMYVLVEDDDTLASVRTPSHGQFGAYHWRLPCERPKPISA